MTRLLRGVPVDQDVLTLARERIAVAFDRFDTIVVSFSGGKDSTAALNIAREEAERRGKLPLKVVFFDEEAIPMQTEEYARRVANDPRYDMTWYCVPVVHRNGCSRKSPFWYPWAAEDREKWVRELPPEAVTSIPGYHADDPSRRMSIPNLAGLILPPSLGSVGMVMGIRAQESLIRRRAVITKREENFLIHFTEGTAGRGKNIWKVYPVYDWQTEDIWTVTRDLHWDYCEAYDHMMMMGVPINQQRLAPPYGEEPLRALDQFMECFPEVAGKMLYRVPGAATAVRYSKTELYSFGRVPDPYEGETWQDAVLRYTRMFPPSEQKHVHQAITGLIRFHYQETIDPIVVDAPHPSSGISWRRLLQVAFRGDFKGRRQRVMNVRATKEIVKKYQAERERLESLPDGIVSVTGDTEYVRSLARERG